VPVRTGQEMWGVAPVLQRVWTVRPPALRPVRSRRSERDGQPFPTWGQARSVAGVRGV